MNKKRLKLAVISFTAVCLAAVMIFTDKQAENTSQIPDHDGEILVDSINIENAESQATGEAGETQLVTSDNISEAEYSDSYFQELRATVTLDRNQVISMLTDAETTAETATEKKDASQRKMEILDIMEKELAVEAAIAAKGLPECLVLITEQGVNVTVNKQDLTEIDVTQICDIVMRETGMEASKIIVQSKF